MGWQRHTIIGALKTFYGTTADGVPYAQSEQFTHRGRLGNLRNPDMFTRFTQVILADVREKAPHTLLTSSCREHTDPFPLAPNRVLDAGYWANVANSAPRLRLKTYGWILEQSNSSRRSSRHAGAPLALVHSPTPSNPTWGFRGSLRDPRGRSGSHVTAVRHVTCLFLLRALLCF